MILEVLVVNLKLGKELQCTAALSRRFTMSFFVVVLWHGQLNVGKHRCTIRDTVVSSAKSGLIIILTTQNGDTSALD